MPIRGGGADFDTCKNATAAGSLDFLKQDQPIE